MWQKRCERDEDYRPDVPIRDDELAQEGVEYEKSSCFEVFKSEPEICFILKSEVVPKAGEERCGQVGCGDAL